MVSSTSPVLLNVSAGTDANFHLSSFNIEPEQFRLKTPKSRSVEEIFTLHGRISHVNIYDSPRSEASYIHKSIHVSITNISPEDAVFAQD